MGKKSHSSAISITHSVSLFSLLSPSSTNPRSLKNWYILLSTSVMLEASTWGSGIFWNQQSNSHTSVLQWVARCAQVWRCAELEALYPPNPSFTFYPLKNIRLVLFYLLVLIVINKSSESKSKNRYIVLTSAATFCNTFYRQKSCCIIWELNIPGFDPNDPESLASWSVFEWDAAPLRARGAWPQLPFLYTSNQSLYCLQLFGILADSQDPACYQPVCLFSSILSSLWGSWPKRKQDCA